MAFTIKQIKKILSDNGMSVENLESAASEICGKHTADMDALKEERDGYKADAEKLADVQAELEAVKAQSNDGYKEKYEHERDEHKKFREKVEKERDRAEKKAQYTEILKDAGISANRIEKVLKYTNLDKMELDDDGKLADRKTLIKEVKAEWPEYIEKESTKGADTPTPPDGNHSERTGTSRAAQIWAERQKQLYGITEGEKK